MERDLDDQALLALIATGDQEALRQLYARYRLRLYGYLWLQLDRNANWTEEVEQDVFLSIWNSAHTYRGEARVASWIFRIAHHQAAMARRQRNRRAEGYLAEGMSEREGDTCEEHVLSVASHEDEVLNRLMLYEAFDQLSPSHLLVLDLVFRQGFSHMEVSHILAIPVGTVKSRVAYARRALLSFLGEQDRAEKGIGHDT